MYEYIDATTSKHTWRDRRAIARRPRARACGTERASALRRVRRAGVRVRAATQRSRRRARRAERATSQTARGLRPDGPAADGAAAPTCEKWRLLWAN